MFEHIHQKFGSLGIWGMLFIAVLFLCRPMEVNGDKLPSEDVQAIIGKLNNGDPERQVAFGRLRLLLMEKDDSKAVADVAKYLLNVNAARKLDLLWLLTDVAGKHPKSLTPAIDTLIGVFPSLDSAQQLAACRLLSSVPDRSGKVAVLLRDVLKNYASESRIYVRSYAAGALLKLVPDDNEALGFLVRLSASSNVDDQIRAAYAMQWAGASAAAALPVLRTQMRSKDASVRVVSATAALSAGAATDEVIPVLCESLRHHAETFFVEPMHFGAMQLAPNPSRWSANALGKLGPAAAPAVEDLVGELQTDDDLHFRTVAFALENIGSSAKVAIPTLQKMLETETRPQRRHAISQALRKIKPQAGQ